MNIRNQLAFGGIRGIPFKSDLNLRIQNRSGLTMLDEFGNNATILLPYLSKEDTSKSCSYSDNNALDILTNDISIFLKLKVTNTGAAQYHFGKSCNLVQNGAYAIYTDTNNTVGFTFQTSTGSKNKSTSIVATSWISVVAIVDQTLKTCRIYINGVEHGSALSFTGTFSAMPAARQLLLGRAYGATPLPSSASYCDAGIILRKLTSQEILDIEDSVFPTDCAVVYPLNNKLFADVSGNGRTFIPANIVASDFKYGATASRSILNGHVNYKTNPFILQEGVQIPLKKDGSEVSITIPSSTAWSSFAYIKDKAYVPTTATLWDVDGFVKFTSPAFDRSNALIWNDNARTGYYNALDTSVFHLSELNREYLDYMLNSDYRYKIFPVFDYNSYSKREKLNEIVCYNSNKSGNDLSRVLSYTGDSNKRSFRPKYGAGICIQFDDTVRANTWKIADDTLYPLFGWKATFFLDGDQTKLNTYKSSVLSLLSHGHEIGNHSVNHIAWKDYLLTHTVEEFFNTEIQPQQDNINAVFNLIPTVWGYSQQYGENEELNQYVLNHGIPQVRIGVDPNEFLVNVINDCTYYADRSKLYTIDLKNYPTNDSGTDAILAHIDIAKRMNLVILFVSHNISTFNGDLDISLSRLTAICQRVVDNGMSFYSISELNESLLY